MDLAVDKVFLFNGNTTKSWTASDTSSDGQVICACVHYSQSVYISTDGGTTWTERRPAGDTYLQRWRGCSVSADGSVIFVCCATGTNGVGGVYRSTNTGATWSNVSPAGAVYYPDVACSKTDGSKVIVTVYNGLVYTSTNTGTDWTERHPAGGSSNWYWWGCAISDDGAFSIVCGEDTRVWYANDTFVTWAETRPNGDSTRHWSKVRCDADGSHIIIGQFLDGVDGRVYITTNSMANWAETKPAGTVNVYWFELDISGDGAIMTASTDIKFYSSSNSGANWAEEQPAGAITGYWCHCISGDGDIIYAGKYSTAGYIYKKVDGSWSDINAIATWADYTIPANEDTANDVNILPFPISAGSGLYIGYPLPYSRLVIHMGTAGTGTYTIQFKYYNGATWENLTTIYNYIADCKYTDSLSAVWDKPSNWAPVTINGVSKYWLFLSYVSGTVTAQPKANRIWVGMIDETLSILPIFSTMGIHMVANRILR